MEPGLYLVATPIGNLDDITIRALNVLKNSEIIFCENTKIVKNFLKNIQLKQNIISILIMILIEKKMKYYKT